MNTERFSSSAGKSALIALSIFALTLLVGAGARPLRGAQHATVASAAKRGAAVTPFTLKTQLLSFDDQSPYTGFMMQLAARRADGATVTLAYRSGTSEEQTNFRTITYPDGRRIEVLDKSHVVTRWPADAKVAAAISHRFAISKQECRQTPGEYVAGHVMLDGVSAVIVKAFPKGSAGMTWWLAPRLGCADLQDTYTEVQADGSFKLATETKLVSIKLGAPDAALFTVPSDYTNVKPSRALHLEAEDLGQKWNLDLQAQAEREDAEYSHLQQAAKSDH